MCHKMERFEKKDLDRCFKMREVFCNLKGSPIKNIEAARAHFIKCKECMEWAIKHGYDVEKVFREALE